MIIIPGITSLVNQTYFFSFYIRAGNLKGKKVSLVHETKESPVGITESLESIRNHWNLLLRISKSLQRIRKAPSKIHDRMYTYFKEIDHVFCFALYGYVAKIWKSSVGITESREYREGITESITVTCRLFTGAIYLTCHSVLQFGLHHLVVFCHRDFSECRTVQ